MLVVQQQYKIVQVFAVVMQLKMLAEHVMEMVQHVVHITLVLQMQLIHLLI